MPTLKQIIEEKASRLESVPNALISSVEKSQKAIFDELIVLVENLETEAGKILLSENNLVQVEIIVNKLKGSVYGSEYLEAVGSFAGEFNTQAQLNNEYFTKILNEDFTTKAIYDNILKASQRDAVALLTDAGVNQAFFIPMKNILNTSVTTGQSMGEAIKALRAFVEGNTEIDGTLLRHVKQVARDGFSFSDRQYTNIVANDIGLEFYRYVGGTVDDTRDFCSQRTGKYFHKKEIEKWEKLSWQGKAKGTTESTIFVFAGGYNCLHSILPVSTYSVPKEVIQRNEDNGNYKPSQE
jgi:hypothetical protein